MVLACLNLAAEMRKDSWIFARNPLQQHCAISLCLEKKRCKIIWLLGTLTPSILVRIQVPQPVFSKSYEQAGPASRGPATAGLPNQIRCFYAAPFPFGVESNRPA
jgi:hypothetical protein